MLESGALDHSAILTTGRFEYSLKSFFYEDETLYLSVNGVITNRLLFPKYLNIISDYNTIT